MDSMSRIQAAFDFMPVDRIPRYEIFLEGYQQAFRKRQQLNAGSSIYDWYSRVDIGTILADQRGPFYRNERLLADDGDATLMKDSWGRLLRQKRSAAFEQALEIAIPEKKVLDQLVFDDPGSADKYDAIAAAVPAVRQRFAPVSGILGLFMGSYRMRGEFDYLVDLAEDRPFCEALADRLTDYLTVTGLALARRTNTLETAIWVYDELASTQGPLFSPAIFDSVFQPRYKKMIKTWRQAGMRHVILHCDGNCLPLMDSLLDAGFDGIQGIAPSTGMWLPDIKKKYGNRLILIGGMDNIRTLVQGSCKEIESQTQALIEAAADGGVVIGTHSIDGDVPIDNYDCYSAYLDRHDRDGLIDNSRQSADSDG
jgi:uroporphyrinogen decarboxylase